ncbi:MAG: hypothetical protein GX456_12835 [Verrucomicrobia bacterium]|nr:hypothetical protein [Verrucomicrobiota bacterium]
MLVSKPPKGGTLTRKSHRLTSPRHPKLHSCEISAPGGYASGLRPSNHRRASAVPAQIWCEIQ